MDDDVTLSPATEEGVLTEESSHKELRQIALGLQHAEVGHRAKRARMPTAKRLSPHIHGLARFLLSSPERLPLAWNSRSRLTMELSVFGGVLGTYLEHTQVELLARSDTGGGRKTNERERRLSL